MKALGRKTEISDIFLQNIWGGGYPSLRHNPLTKLPIWDSHRCSDLILNIHNFLISGPIYFRHSACLNFLLSLKRTYYGVGLPFKKYLKITSCWIVIYENCSTYLFFHPYREFGVPEGKLVYNRPSLLQMLSEFRRANLIAIISGLSFTFILAVLWPVIMSTMGVLNKSEFRSWIYLCETWAILGGAFIIFVPIVTEIREIAMRLKENKDRMMVGPEEERNPPARRAGQSLPQGPNVRQVPTISGDTALS